MTKAVTSACRTTVKSKSLSERSINDWLDRVADRNALLLGMMETQPQLMRALLREGSLEHVWHEFHAHPYQRWPDENETPWTVWLLLGGRGAGKTRAGAEWIRDFVRKRRNARVALVSETYADGREVMIDGNSGLSHLGPERERPHYEASRRRLIFPSGSVAYVFSSEDPDGIRGHQFDAAWSDELCKWKHAEETWSNLQLALRLGERPRQVVTTTPRPTPLLKRILAAQGTITHRATTYDNAANLPRAFLDEIAAVYEGTSLGRQELLGELIEDVAGALWSQAMISAARITLPPGFHASLDRIVVAVDPPTTSGEAADECGIIVAGLMSRDDGAVAFVLDDRSEGGLSPRQWAMRAIAAYHDYGADRIIVEANQGGDMAREIIRGLDASVAVREVYATRGKRLRAEPVAALYEQGRVRHAAAFPKLEDQMTTYTGEGPKGPAKSPDRLDALVWALTDLMLRKSAAPRIKKIL